MPTGPEYLRLQRGQRVPAALLNAHSEALEGFSAAALAGGGFELQGIPVLPPPVPDSFLVKITAKDASTPPKYSWVAWTDPDTDGAQTYDPMGVTGGPGATLDAFPAYPYDPAADVPSGSIVLLEPSTWGECYRFHWQPFAGTIPGSPTFSGTVTFTGTPVFSNGFTVSGGTVTFTGTSSVAWTSTGTFLFTAGGLVLGQTTLPGTRPAGYLVLPWITGGQVPTYPGDEGEVLCNGPYIFQSDGTDWFVHVSFPASELPLPGGSIPYTDGGTFLDLPIGSSGDVLTVSGGVPIWAPPAAATLPPVQAVALGGTPTLSAVPCWVEVTLAHTDFNASATNPQTKNLLVLPAGACHHTSYGRKTSGWSGGGITLTSLSLGLSGGSTGAYWSGYSMGTAAPSATEKGGPYAPTGGVGVESFTASTTLTVTIATTGGNPTALTAGGAKIRLLLSQAW